MGFDDIVKVMKDKREEKDLAYLRYKQNRLQELVSLSAEADIALDGRRSRAKKLKAQLEAERRSTRSYRR